MEDNELEEFGLANASPDDSVRASLDSVKASPDDISRVSFDDGAGTSPGKVPLNGNDWLNLLLNVTKNVLTDLAINKFINAGKKSEASKDIPNILTTKVSEVAKKVDPNTIGEIPKATPGRYLTMDEILELSRKP